MSIHHCYQNDLFKHANLIMSLSCIKSSHGSTNLENKIQKPDARHSTPFLIWALPAHVSHMGWPTVLWTNQALSSLCTYSCLSLEHPFPCLPNKLLLMFKFLTQKSLLLRNHPWFLWANLVTPSTILLYLLYWIVIIVCISFSTLNENILFIYRYHLAFNKCYLQEWIAVLIFT